MKFKQLDLVLTPEKDLALVCQVTENGHCSLEYVGEKKVLKDWPYTGKVAWWEPKDLIYVDNLTSVLSRALNS